MNNGSSTNLKRKNDTNSESKRQRPKIDMNQGPRIPVRSTLSSRSNTNSPTTNNKRFSNASTSSNTSTNSSVSLTAKPKMKPSLSASRTKLTPSRAKPVNKKNAAIPAWDTKGRMNQLQAQLDETGEEVNEIEKLQNDLQSTVQSTESLALEARQKAAELENIVKTTEERHQDEIKRIQDKFQSKNRGRILENEKQRSAVSSFETQLHHIQKSSRDTAIALDEEKRENLSLKTTKEKMEASFAEVDASFKTKRMKKQSTTIALEEAKDSLVALSSYQEEKVALARELERTLLGREKERRRDHDRLQELKGNIRVFCRVRPALNTKSETNLANMRFFGEDNESMELSEQVHSTLGKSSTKLYSFTFDRVFSPTDTQNDCFEEISQLVQSALDGFNVCIFAYGQTGSGKTFTMQGPNLPNEETAGMIPRAVQQIYDVAQQLKQFGWDYTMQGQFLEIYNEAIHDLLGNASHYGRIKHEIHHDKSGNTTVTDMTSVVLDSPSKVKSMLKKASQNRATGATNLNERSSRSHSVFTLRLTGENPSTGERTVGILNLIDLAGSERLSMSGSVGDRLRETQAINKSLSCLGDVIHALVNNKEGGHIPYRNSKLTYLLRNSLGGNCKTLMFVNVSPLAEHFGESLCSLRFATKVNSCHVGTARKLSNK